jgi:hypothetical protein
LYKILENKLATNGIGQFTYDYLSEGNHQTNESTVDSWPVLDARDDLCDNDSNSLEVYEKKIDLAWDLIQKYGRVVICRAAGISRSNAIALGVLVKYFHMDFHDAWELIENRVPICNIHPGHISQLKKLFNTTLQ